MLVKTLFKVTKILYVFLFSETLVRSTDISFLFDENLVKCAHKWREIGMALKFEHDELEAINVGLEPAPQKFYKLLSIWSEWPVVNHPVAPTLEKLRDALRSQLVGYGATANTLYEMRSSLPSLW